MVEPVSANSTLDFYKNLKPVYDYRRICDLSYYQDVPDDWTLVLCDIQNSTQAIQLGKYKEVNFVGAACIIVLVNTLSEFKIPYVFGGDGATLLLPSEGIERAKSALISIQKISLEEYGLTLRVAAVPILELKQKSFIFKVAKFSLSTDLSIALFSGNGFFEAEKKVKSLEGTKYLLNSKNSLEEVVNLEGLECRWESFPSTRGEIVSVLVKARSDKPEDAAKIYQEIIEEIEVICGGKDEANPATLNKLKLNTRAKELAIEKKARSYGESFFKKTMYLIKILFENFLGKFLMFLNLKALGIDWGLYKKQVVNHSDFWKFDDTLRFVFDVSGAQKRALIACLEAKKREAKVFYGIHSSSSALMTCLIFDRQGEHVHFIDGAEGGYAIAALQLKEEMKVF